MQLIFQQGEGLHRTINASTKVAIIVLSGACWSTIAVFQHDVFCNLVMMVWSSVQRHECLWALRRVSQTWRLSSSHDDLGRSNSRKFCVITSYSAIGAQTRELYRTFGSLFPACRLVACWVVRRNIQEICSSRSHCHGLSSSNNMLLLCLCCRSMLWYYFTLTTCSGEHRLYTDHEPILHHGLLQQPILKRRYSKNS